MEQYSINLLKSRSRLSGNDLLIQKQLKKITTVVVVFTFIVGFIISSIFIGLKLRLGSLENKRTTVTKSISLQARKQILLLAIRDRLPVIEKAIDTQYPWDRVIGDLALIASPPALKSLSVGQNTTITIKAKANSLEEVAQMIESSINLTKAKKIIQPQIVNLTASKEEGLDITLSLVPVL